MFKILFLLLIPTLISGCVATGDSYGTNAFNPHLKLGLSYLQDGKREASRHHLERALKLRPNAASVYRGFGLLYQSMGEMVSAERSFLKALRKDNNDTMTQISYGHFLYHQSRYQEAYDLFKKAKETHQELSFKQQALLLTHLGRSALKLGDKAKAKSVFKHAINIDNKLALPMIELSDIYYHEADYVKSRSYLKRHMAIAGRSARSLWLSIRIERIFGNKDKEASHILALKNLHPDSQEYREYLEELPHRD